MGPARAPGRCVALRLRAATRARRAGGRRCVRSCEGSERAGGRAVQCAKSAAPSVARARECTRAGGRSRESERVRAGGLRRVAFPHLRSERSESPCGPATLGACWGVARSPSCATLGHERRETERRSVAAHGHRDSASICCGSSRCVPRAVDETTDRLRRVSRHRRIETAARRTSRPVTRPRSR
jgi:hypothetical protein